MQYANYTKLLNDVGTLAGLDTPARLIDGGQLDISGHAVSIRYDEHIDPLRAIVHVDLGEVPEEDREAVYRCALEVNFHSVSGANGAISLDPQTAHLQYSFAFPLDDSRTAQNLLDTVTDLVDSLDQTEAEEDSGHGGFVGFARQLAV